MGVSCSADRQIKGRITRDGVWLEALETDPAQYLPGPNASPHDVEAPARIELDRPMADILSDLSALPTGAPVLLSGTMIVARDLVHAELAKRLASGGGLPDYMKNHPIYYAGPAKTPKGQASGSFGPTTAARMDPYIPEFQAAGCSLITIAKGNRTRAVTDSCQQHGGFYLASIGGAAAVLGKDIIKAVEPVDFQDFGMEAVWRIAVQDFPAFIIIDDKGNDFYAQGARA
jgi:fumarate hydratase class I